MKKLFKTKFNLYLRKEPNRSSKGILVYAGTSVESVEILKGEMVDGVDEWCKHKNGLYFWLGGVEEIVASSTNFIWPLEVDYKRITTPFSENWILNLKKKHTGIDIAVPTGKKVYAVADCVVKKIGFLDTNKTMAQYVGVQHDTENLCTAYLHIDPIVKVGDKLKAKDLIGHIGNLIGMGAHLHFNVWKGTYNNAISHRGALPSVEYAGKIQPLKDPAFPGNFIDPMSIVYLD